MNKPFAIALVSLMLFSRIGYAAEETGAKKPDLIISSFKVMPPEPTSNDEIRIEGLKYRNIGDVAVPDATEICLGCRIFKKDGSLFKICSDAAFKYYGLRPDSETTAVNYYIGAIMAGEYRVELTCDSLKTVNESNEANNTVSFFLTVKNSN